MRKTVYVHIGGPKTASSYLQGFLYENSEWLRSRGVYWCAPLYDTGFHNHADLAICCNESGVEDVSSRIFSKKAQVLRHYRDEFEKAKSFEGALLSAENFLDQPSVELFSSADEYWAAKKVFYQNLKALLPVEADVAIIVYLRPQDEWIESWFNNSIRNRKRLRCDIEQFMHEQSVLMDYRKQLGVLSEVFGRQSLRVKAYVSPSSDKNWEILQGFLALLGVFDFPPSFTAKASAENKRIPREMLDIQHMLNNAEMSIELRTNIEKGLRAYAASYKSDSDHIYLSPEQRRYLSETYSPGNRALCREYAVEGDLEISESKVSKYAGLAPESVMEFFVWLASLDSFAKRRKSFAALALEKFFRRAE